MAGKIRGEQIKDDSVTGADVDESTLVLRHVYSVKYSKSDNVDPVWIRWNANGSNSSPGVNNKFIMPGSGSIKKVLIRSTSAMGSTMISLHKASDGDADLSTQRIDPQIVNVSSANTVVTATFSSASFNAHDIIGISVIPTSAHGNVDMTVIIEMDF